MFYSILNRIIRAGFVGMCVKSLLAITPPVVIMIAVDGSALLLGLQNREYFLIMSFLGIIVLLTMLGLYGIWMEVRTFADRMAGTKDHSVNTDQD